MKILVADDQECLRGFYKSAFDRMNLDVELCADGQACLDLLRQKSFDVLFLDLIMPLVDGETVLRTVAQEFPNLRVVVASVQDDEHAIKELFQLGATAYLTKPFTFEQLGEITNRLNADRETA